MANGMRASWSGTITFAMMAIPVKLYKSTGSAGTDFAFNQLHRDCGSTINYVKMCRNHEDGPVELAAADIKRGYQYTKGQFIDIEDEDLEHLPLPTKGAIELDQFAKLDEIDPVYFETSYYVEPSPQGAKPYSLLVNAMKAQDAVALGKITLRSRESAVVLRAVGNKLVLSTMFYGNEIRDFDVNPVGSSEAEQRMANQLVSALMEPFDPNKYHDTYGEAMGQLIQAKLEGVELPTTPAPSAPAATDLMAQLQASLAAVQGRKPAAEAETTAPAAEKEYAF